MEDPNLMQPNSESNQLKFQFAGTLSAIIRTIIDISKPIPTLGAGTLPEWIKAISISKPIETELLVLLTNSLINACRHQLRPRIDDINKEEGKFFYLEREIKFLQNDLKSGLVDNEYTLDLQQLKEPRAFAQAILKDFKPFYQDWLQDSFPISKDHLNALVVDFEDYFAHAFLLELSTNASFYPQLIAANQNPFNDKLRLELNRRQYRLTLKSYYHRPALGESNIALSDVYIEPEFLVYEKILSGDKREKLKWKYAIQNDHFIPTEFDGDLHHYLIQCFIPKQSSKAIDSEVEKSRLLLLLGQPGHGKSSFCYRAINDLLNSPDFHGQVFFVRLQEASREILNRPLVGMAETSSIYSADIDFQAWIKAQRQEPVVIFLDGLDEFFMTQSLRDSDILQFLNNCKLLLNKHPNLYFIITSRFNYIESSKLFNDDGLLLSLGTLDIGQQERLVNFYKKRIGTNKTCNLSKALIKKINDGKDDNLSHLKELIELPILLQMVLISNIPIKDTNSRAQIYNQLFTTVLNRKWDKNKRLKKYKAESNFKQEHLRDYIAFLAYKLFQQNKGYLNKADVEQYPETKRFVKRRLQIEVEEGQLKEVLKDILTSFYLKESKNNITSRNTASDEHDYAIEFLHKSLYEYLACEHLWEATKKFFLARDEDDTDERKDYEIEEVQRKLQSLFATTRMTDETVGYMKEIIHKEVEYHAPLLSRMAYYLPKLLKQGWLYDYKSTSQSAFTAEQQVLNIFHNYCLIGGELLEPVIQEKLKDQEKIKDDFIEQWPEKLRWNQAIEKEKYRFITLLRLAGAARLSIALSFSFINLERIDLVWLITMLR